MRQLSQSVALALPACEERDWTNAALLEARRRQRDVEVRIGVGPFLRGVPIRVIGYAACAAEALRSDVAAVARRPDRIVIFSSAPKLTRSLEYSDGSFLLLAALAGSLRLAGVDIPILIDLADPSQEVPTTLAVQLPLKLTDWLGRAAAHSGNEIDPRWYAVEHAAASMFGDLLPTECRESPLRITLGGACEAKFWAARSRVRLAALDRGLPVAPALGIILRTCRVPWYAPISQEPLLPTTDLSPALAALESAANPERGGNHGLLREARAAKRLRSHPGTEALCRSLADVRSALNLVLASGFELGPRLRSIYS